MPIDLQSSSRLPSKLNHSVSSLQRESLTMLGIGIMAKRQQQCNDRINFIRQSNNYCTCSRLSSLLRVSMQSRFAYSWDRRRAKSWWTCYPNTETCVKNRFPYINTRSKRKVEIHLVRVHVSSLSGTELLVVVCARQIGIRRPFAPYALRRTCVYICMYDNRKKWRTTRVAWRRSITTII